MSLTLTARAHCPATVRHNMSTKTALPAQCLLICALSFQYGYNIAALNALQAPLSCPGQHRQWSLAALPECFDMTVR